MIKKIIKKLISFLQNFDNSNEQVYNNNTDWALVRKLFPGLKIIEDKKLLNKLLNEQISQTETTFKKLLGTFYRSKVSDLISTKQYSEIYKYEGIIELLNEIDYFNNNNLNYGENK